MAQVTKTDLETMDFVYQGQPFVSVPAKDEIDLSTMDYVYQGEPFVDGVGGGGAGGVAGKQSHVTIAVCIGIR